MPILQWLTRDQDLTAADRVPYRLLEEVAGFWMCSIPDDHIDPRRSALFMASLILREVRDGGRMLISLHKPATTTPKIRAAIQASSEPAYGISEQTVWQWRDRDDVHDRSHIPHRLQTALTPAQEAVAVALRKALLLPLDDLLAVLREVLSPNVSRSGLDGRLRRNGAGNLRALKPREPKPAHGTFKACAPGRMRQLTLWSWERPASPSASPDCVRAFAIRVATWRSSIWALLTGIGPNRLLK